ncbi:MAG: F0F1 ATP synthase subunit B [Gallionellaceae bacterium]|nr:F0F1 ATP synthase subunit B [Gallionellaceae bacterium]
MLIDWFTVIAQAANFLILVWLLKRFLYQPILNAIDAREKRIAAELANAGTKQAEAQNERETFQHKNKELDQQRALLLSQAAEEAQSERQYLLDQARKEAAALDAKLQESLRNEQLSLTREITSRTQQEVFAIARKALADLAGISLEERMAEVFLRRLRDFNSDEKAQLTSSLMLQEDTIVVRSAFDLPQAQQDLLEISLRELLAADAQVRFETAPNLVSGIELVIGGHKVAWSIADYLASLERNTGELLNNKRKPQP